MKEIALSNGMAALVDDEDYERLSAYRWWSVKGRNTFYAVRHKRSENHQIIRMHRDVLGLPYKNGTIVDHINQNGLDNRKANLRVATPSLNSYNCRRHKTNTSGYRGVSWRKDDSTWEARIETDGAVRNLGAFADKVNAALAYDLAALKYRGETAVLNFPILLPNIQDMLSDLRSRLAEAEKAIEKVRAECDTCTFRLERDDLRAKLAEMEKALQGGCSTAEPGVKETCCNCQHLDEPESNPYCRKCTDGDNGWEALKEADDADK